MRGPLRQVVEYLPSRHGWRPEKLSCGHIVEPSSKIPGRRCCPQCPPDAPDDLPKRRPSRLRVRQPCEGYRQAVVLVARERLFRTYVYRLTLACGHTVVQREPRCGLHAVCTAKHAVAQP